jgi:outer membrane protein
MKKIFLIASFLIAAIVSQAQHYAVIDTKYILGKMPDYVQAQSKLKQKSIEWQRDIDEKQGIVDQMNKDYDAEQYMLTDELKKKRQDEIYNKQKEVRDLEKQRFGYQGDLFKAREDLVKPLQDEVYNAVQKIAAAHGYDFVLDKSEGITIIFADPKLDKSDEVLAQLGIRK